MNFDCFQPETPLGKKINCFTLTKNFFDKNYINADKNNLISNFLSFNGVPIQYMDQVHGKNVEFISSYSTIPSFNCDALFCSKSNLALAALSADCMPIALSKNDGSDFAIIHAGWKGLVSGVIESCVSAFTDEGETLSAWIGPSISKENYEVDKDIYDTFTHKDKNSEINFIKKDTNKWLFNLREEAERILKKYKIKVQTSDVCTHDSTYLYSYRKERTNNRLVTIIWRNK